MKWYYQGQSFSIDKESNGKIRLIILSLFVYFLLLHFHLKHKYVGKNINVITPFRTKRGLFLEELEAIFVVNFFHLICFLRTILQCWTVCTNTCLYLECTVHVLRRFVMNHLMEVSINCHKIINGFKKDIAVGLCFVYICTGLNMPYIT